MYKTEVDNFETQAKALIADASKLSGIVDELMPITPLHDKDPSHFLVHIAFDGFVAAAKLLVFAFKQMPMENWSPDDE